MFSWLGVHRANKSSITSWKRSSLYAGPDRQISFINLGWAGDNPSAIARGYFGGAQEGFRRLLEELRSNQTHPQSSFVTAPTLSPAPFQIDFKKLFNELKNTLQQPYYPLASSRRRRTRDGRIDPQPTNLKRAEISNFLSNFRHDTSGPQNPIRGSV